MSLASCRSSESNSGAVGEAAADGRADVPAVVVRESIADSLAAHMRMMDRASGDDIRAMLPVHQQLATKALHRMTTEIWALNMRVDPAWNATVDSLRHDLDRMIALNPRGLEAVMPAHSARWMRLVGAYRETLARTRR